MALPPAKKPAGMEIMLRSMGLGEVLDMAHKLAEGGTVEAILNFARGLDQLNANLQTISDRLERLEARSGAGPQPGSDPAHIGVTNGSGRSALEGD